MQTKTIRFEKIEVENLSLKEGANLKIFYNDGTTRVLDYFSTFTNPEQDSVNILQQVKTAVKGQNSHILSDNPIDRYVQIMFEDDEGSQEKIANFIKSVKDKIHKVKYSRMATGYLDSLNSLKSLKMKF
jgi:hypothetical protein